jgi:hypothetical protein
MGISQFNSFEWWQALLILAVFLAAPLIRAIAVVIVGKFVKPDIAKIALPLIFPRKYKNHKKINH